MQGAGQPEADERAHETQRDGDQASAPGEAADGLPQSAANAGDKQQKKKVEHRHGLTPLGVLYPCCKCHAGACALHFLMPRKGEHGVVRARVRFIATHKKNFRRATASCLVVFCELRFP